MKQFHSIVIFCVLMLSAAATSFCSYQATESEVVADLNQALARTLSTKKAGWITPDTIRAYCQLQSSMGEDMELRIESESFRRHLRMKPLRDKAALSFSLACNEQKRSRLQSDTIIWQDAALPTSVAFSAKVQCSAAALFAMSDQRLSLVLALGSLCWLMGSTLWLRRKGETKLMVCAALPAVLSGETAFEAGASEQADTCTHGGLCLTNADMTFRNNRGEEVHFTPMQHQLMQLFFASPDMRLTKSCICDTLWPRKEDASETLYTLIRRLKPILAENSTLRIEVDRGRAYRLVCQ